MVEDNDIWTAIIDVTTTAGTVTDSLDILEMILDYDNLFSICLWSLVDGVKRISDNEYPDYAQMFVLKLEKGNVEQINILCENMRKLARTSEEEIVRKRARNLFKEFFRKTLG
ncbi:MAG: hypothetical protein WAM14_16095 [Candidatus Nitrosopolaris sp.]